MDKMRDEFEALAACQPQERGEAVAQIAAAIADEAAQEWVDLGGSRVHYRTANWAALRMAQELGRTHPTPDAGRVAELERVKAEQLSKIGDLLRRNAALEAQLTASLEREGRMREVAHCAYCGGDKFEFVEAAADAYVATNQKAPSIIAVRKLAAEKGEKE